MTWFGVVQSAADAKEFKDASGNNREKVLKIDILDKSDGSKRNKGAK
jgi:hypothetical protein